MSGTGGGLIEVVIATRDRPEALARVLAALAGVRPVAGWRLAIRVVDNAPAAGAGPVVEHARAECPWPIDWLHEPRPGVCRARNRALAAVAPGAAATAVLDDDVLPDPDWLAAAAAALADWPRAGAIGGRVTLHDPRDLRITVLLRETPARMGWGGDPLGLVYSCNMLLRPAALARAGLFDERLGPGAPGRAGEDADLSFRVWRAGFDVVYDPRPTVAHDHGRRTLEQKRALERAYAFGAGAFYCKHLLLRPSPALAVALARKLWKDWRIGPLKTYVWPEIRRGAIGYLRARLGRV